LSTIKLASVVKNIAVVAFTALFVSGCSYYDYLQNTDKISYGAGDAVRANIEGQTINPSSGAQHDVSGLGQNGPVVDPGTGEVVTP